MAKGKRKKDKKESTKIEQHELYSNINTTLRECIVAERYGCKTTRDVQWSYGIFLGYCSTVFYCIYKIAIDMLLLIFPIHYDGFHNQFSQNRMIFGGDIT